MALNARIGLDLSDFKKSLGEIEKHLGGMHGTLNSFGKVLAGAFTVGAVTRAVGQFTEFTSKLTDLSAKTGISASALQTLKYAAEQSGGSIEQVSQAVVQMGRRLVEGDKSTVGAMKALGLSLAEVQRMQPDKAFTTIADAIAKVPNPLERSKLAMDLFGRSGAELLPILTGNLSETADKARQLGIILDDETVAAGDHFGDTLSALQGVGMAVIAQVLKPFLPLLQYLADAAMGAGKAVTWLQQGFQTLLTWGLKALKFFVDQAVMVGDLAAKFGGPLAKSLGVTAENMNQLRGVSAALNDTIKGMEMEVPKAAVAHTAKLAPALRTTTNETDKADKALAAYLKKLDAQIIVANRAASAQQFYNQGIVTNLQKGLLPMAPALELVTDQFRDQYGVLGDLNEELVGLAPAIKGIVPPLKEAEDAGRGLSDAFKSLLSGDLKSVFKDIGNFFKSGVKSIGTGFLESMGEGLLGMLTNLIGKGLSAAWSGIKRLFGGKSENLKLDEQATKDLKAYGQEWINTAGGIEQARQRAAAFGYDLDGILGNKSRKGFENVKTDLGAIDEKWAKLQAAMDKYGISVEDLGPKFKQIAQNDWAEQLSSDFAILMEAGAASDAVLLKMKDDVNAFVARSIRMGTEVPDSMLPMLEQMAKMGILTDESGNLITDLETSGLKFSKTMTEAFKGVEDAILALPDAIARALGVIPKEVHIPVDVEITRRYRDSGEPDVPSFATGTRGQYVNFGSGSLAMLHGYEKITPASGGGGDGVGAQTSIDLAALQDEVQGLRRDFTFTIPNLIAKATVTALTKAGSR